MSENLIVPCRRTGKRITPILDGFAGWTYDLAEVEVLEDAGSVKERGKDVPRFRRGRKLFVAWGSHTDSRANYSGPMARVEEHPDCWLLPIVAS